MKIGILIPSRFDLALLCKVRELCRLLLRSQPVTGDSIELAVGLPDMVESEWLRAERFLRADMKQVIVRHLRWEVIAAKNAGRMFMKHGLQVDLDGLSEVKVPRDWGWNFTDCDFWINFVDPALGGMLPLKPTAHYVSDLSARYVPEGFGVNLDDPCWKQQIDCFRLLRQSSVVVVTDPHTALDAVGYAGVRRNLVVQMPSLSFSDEPVVAATTANDKEQWVWLLEANARHDIGSALGGLQIYLREGGACLPIIACADPEALDPERHHPSLARIDTSGRELLADLPKVRYGDFASLSRLINRSSLLWSSEVASGDGFAMSLARRHGVQFMGCDFPQHADLAAAFAGGVHLYPASDPIVIADALHEMEASNNLISEPEPNVLDQDMRVQQYGFLIDQMLEHVHG